MYSIRCIRYSFVLFLCFGTFAIARAEAIDAYVVNLSLTTDGVLSVQERISYDFTSSKHGIYRCIPKLHHEQSFSLVWERYVDIELMDVTLDGDPVPYSTEDTRSAFCVRIGDEDQTVAGQRVYTLTYTVAGAVSYSPSIGAELYWDATGNEWGVPIRQAKVTLSGVSGLMLRGQACYRGTVGEPGSCDQSSFDGATTSTFSAFNLAPYEGITIAQSLDPAKIAPDIRKRMKMGFLLVFFVPLTLGIVSLLLYRSFTKHKTGKSIIAQYEPYPGVKPMYMGALFDGRLDPRDISAGIVYLAERGYIHIRKTEKKVLFFFEVDDYALSVPKTIDESTLAAAEGIFEAKLMRILFSKQSVPSEDGKYVWREGTTVSLSDFKDAASMNNDGDLKMSELQKDVEKDLITRGFFQHIIKFDMQHMLRDIPAFALLFLLYVLSALSLWFFMLLCISVVIFSVVHKRRTRAGYEALDHLKGFREFLSVTEAERFTFHNAPHKNPTQFMEYLPYAIAFGVEKEWARVFEGVSIQNPAWYEGGVASNFDAPSLTNSLSGFSSSFASAAFAGQGGSSGSSGGGFSGGGSGGGGGGSW